MLAIFETLQFKKGIASAYTLLAAAYLELEDYPFAKTYLQKAIKLDGEINNRTELIQNYNRYGGLFMYTENYDSALAWYKKTLKMREQMNDRAGIYQAYNNIGSVLVEKKQYDEGIHYFQKALTLCESVNNNKISIGGIFQNLGKAYLLKKEFNKADYYLKRALIVTKQIQTLKEQQGVYGVLTELEEERGDFKKALTYQKLSQSILDSIYNEDKTKLLAEAETRYETAKKEQTIALLEKDKQLQSIWQYLLAAGALVIGVIYVLQRSRTKKAKELLRVQETLNYKLQETDQLKSRFFANISHEFRTPLSLILAPLEDKLNSPTLSTQDKEDLKLVSRNANRLLNLVNQLLDLSKIDAGKMELNLAAGDLAKFFHVLVASFESLARSKNIFFSNQISLPYASVKFDADKIEKIVTNILFNAFKFTPAGGTVTLDITALPDQQTVSIKISDTGKGIPTEDLPHVFSAFYQSKHISDDTQMGSGLGLTLVSELVKLYQGKIELCSVVGDGTTISITLPVVADESIDVTQAQSYPAANQRQFNNDLVYHGEQELITASDGEAKDIILIVEDNQELRNFIASSFVDVTVITASDGEEGFSKAVEFIPDVIISDVMMPVMDGIELTDKIKSDERTSHIPVVLLTAKAGNDSRIQGFKTGADDYISKPFSKEELLIRVANLIKLRKQLIAKFRERIDTPLASKKELTIDEKFIRKAQETIYKNLSDSRFGVENLAEEMNLSRAQLFRKFKALVGTSPSEFINDIRLQRAADLIIAKTDTIAQISYAVGFNEQSYFANRFRKKYGMSPSEYGTTNLN